MSISYETVQKTTDPEIMIKYAKEGVIDNNRTNGASFSDWDSGQHIAEVYLSHCEHAVPDAVIEALDSWLDEKRGSETEIFGRLDADGNVRVLHDEDGEPVRRLDADVYPVGSNLSVRYEHPEGIILSKEDADKLGIEME